MTVQCTLDQIKNWTPKKPETNISSEDLLVLSAAWYRSRTNNGPNFSSLTDTELSEYVNEEDRKQADVIRDHFSKKIMMWALKGTTLTNFRTDLSAFIHSSGNIFTNETLPLVFRLPEFYEYDMAFAQMKASFSPVIETGKYAKVPQLKLYPIKNLNRKLKSGYKHEYWLRNQEGHAHLILIDHHNILKSMWDREFKKEHIFVTAPMTCKLEQDDLSYFKLSKWSID